MKLVINPDELGQDPNPGLDLACELGLDRVEVRSAYDRNILTMSEAQVSAFREAIMSRRLQVAAIAAPLWKWGPYDGSAGPVDSFGFPTELSESEKQAALDRALTIAKHLEAPIVRVFSGLRSKPLAPGALEEDRLFLSALRSFAEAGIVLALENEPVCKVATSEELLAVAGSDKLKPLSFWFDIGNYCVVNGPQLDASTVLAPRIRYVQVKDFTRSGNGECAFCAVGKGEVPISQFLDTILPASPDPCVCVETDVQDNRRDAIAQSIAYLRSHAVKGRKE